MSFRRRVIVVGPGRRCRYRPDDWQDAIVSVEQGEITLECDGRVTAHFHAGDLLSLSGLDLSGIYNSGPVPAVLITVRRTSKETS